MPPTLPFEIWACIASYLSNVELKTLSSVNRALCQISLNAWYKTLQVHQLSQYTVAKLQMMRDTASAVGRVQDLEVNISAFETLARLTRFQRLRNQFRRLFSLPGKYPAALTTKSVTSVQKLLLDAIRNMHDLKAVCFDFTRAHDTRQYLSVHEVWSLLSGRVDTLSIYICPDDAHLLPSTFSSILGIKHLYIELRGFRVTEVRGLTELINTASQSLETFAWKSNFCFIDFSSSIHRSFPILHVFPKLKRADLAVWNTTGSEVTTFLNAHGGSLEELNLEFSHPDGGPPVGVAALQLPSLRTLSIAWNWCKWGGPVTIPFQRLWSGANFPMLSCLEINDPYMKMDHVAFFCDVFRESGGNRIRRLSFHCEALNAETFDHLSEAFPNLHTLIVTVISLPKPRDKLWNIESFVAEMAHRQYNGWPLYDLEITPPDRLRYRKTTRFDDFTRPSYLAMQIVASRIPSVRSFFGSGHTDVPREAQWLPLPWCLVNGVVTRGRLHHQVLMKINENG